MNTNYLLQNYISILMYGLAIHCIVCCRLILILASESTCPRPPRKQTAYSK